MPEPVRVFVSHHHGLEEDAFTARLVADLRAAGADVWVDTSGIPSGSFVAKISEGLAGRQWVVLVMTPEALASPWVRAEVEAGLNEYHAGRMLGVIPFVMRPCRDDEIPILWRTLHRYDATKGYEPGRDQLFAALGLSGAPADPPRPQPAIPPAASPPYVAPPERFPPRLASLGYRIAFLTGAEVILPPLCDVPAGPFLMGSDPNKDKGARENEQPQLWVTLGAFQVAKFPVTVAEYACFVRATNRTEPKSTYSQLTWAQQTSGRLDHPVVMVNWHDAVAYAKWLSERTGQLWRLPSEAEWEKSARWDAATGSARIYPWGDQFDAKLCNTSESKKDATTPVGSYPSAASPYGAQDIAGNVSEWTSSAFKPYPYTPTDGRERAGPKENRALRGGSWNYGARYARAAYHSRNLPGELSSNVGFRLVVALIL